MKYSVYPIFLGKTKEEVDLSRSMYRAKPGKSAPRAFGCFALKSEEGEWILVDAGLPSPAEIRSYGLPEGPEEGSPTLGEALGERGIDPKAVKTVILTHMHWDHIWNLDLFPNALIYVQLDEVRYAVYPAPYEFERYCIFEKGPRWAAQLPQMEPVSGDRELFPGLRLLKTPGHTPGGQSVLVETAEGPQIIVGDWVYLRKGYEDCISNASFTSHPDWYESYEKIRATGAKIFPTHDILSYERRVIG